ncbi:MAG TPA: 1,4-alpha-glucan branching protein GlgB [Thermodesulfobacteriota bacterium]|nr:1,4-alpha-glucan branching protein GlgB [Thermodesulfobacteriota bacterium]
MLNDPPKNAGTAVNPTHITDHDIYFFKEGNHFKLYEKLGSHLVTVDGVKGVHFAVWAPNAERVSVVGDFNGWDPLATPLGVRDDWSGIWEGFIPGLGKGTLYKYQIDSKYHMYKVQKGDPYAFMWELPPKTASVVWDLEYEWNDSEWMRTRRDRNSLNSPISIYEVHPGSWRRVPEEGNRYLNYREMAHHLAEYLKETGFTHVEFLPVMEHPFYGSWGYQGAGYFAPTSRYGTPQDFMYLVDHLHRNGIGVILDWVPSHFPTDEYGLGYFDGTHLYEHADARKGFHPDWNSYIFNYGRNEVRSFLISSALFWLEKYHIDGIRVDAVASMLYLDYSREGGDWIPNEFGGRENIEAINFLRRFNEAVYGAHPDVQTYAEESTAWPMVSKPTYLGGLGFGMKWNMGWMHDTLKYFSRDPVFRKYNHSQLTFSIWYAFFENFVLPLSHDEVVHGKGSLLGKMPGDEWQRFANLRLLYGYMFGHPGKKLLFMGAEFGQVKEWAHEESLEWHVLQYGFHSGMKKWVSDLNAVYRSSPALHEADFENEGFEWIDFHDWEESVISFIRKGRTAKETFLVVCNLTPVYRPGYRIGVPSEGFWKEVLNSDASEYGGSGKGNWGGVEAERIRTHKREYSLSLTLPPLSTLFFRHDG